jgi:hypothetical protein
MKAWRYVVFFVSQFLVMSAALILAAGWMSTAVDPYLLASLTLAAYSLAVVVIVGWKENPELSAKEHFLAWRPGIIIIAACYILLFIFT